MDNSLWKPTPSDKVSCAAAAAAAERMCETRL